MTDKAFASAVKRYNRLMYEMCYEYNTIGTSFSESTDGWTIRDLVSEVQYTLDLWLDPMCAPYQDAHDRWMDADEREYLYKDWVSNVAKMKRFVQRYKADALETVCVSSHCSKFD